MPDSTPEKNELRGLKGWLIILGIGIVFSPIKIFFETMQVFRPVLDPETWFALTTKGTELYHPVWAPMLIGELMFNFALLIASVVLVYFYFSKHHRFPVLYIAIMLISLIFMPLDAGLVKIVLPEEPLFSTEEMFEYIRLLLNGAVWIPYVLLSRRVRATFVRKPPPVPSLRLSPEFS